MHGNFVADHYRVLDSGPSSGPKTQRSKVGIWFSRSRPCDRLPHKRSRNSPLFDLGVMPSANSFPIRVVKIGRSAPPRHSTISPRLHILFRPSYWRRISPPISAASCPAVVRAIRTGLSRSLSRRIHGDCTASKKPAHARLPYFAESTQSRLGACLHCVFFGKFSVTL